MKIYLQMEGGGQLTGIKNIGNSCYVNAISQLLIMIDGFPITISNNSKYKEYGEFLIDLVNRENYISINEEEYIKQCLVPTGFDKSQKDPVNDLLLDLLKQTNYNKMKFKTKDTVMEEYIISFIDPKKSIQECINNYINIHGNFTSTSDYFLINLAINKDYNIQNLVLNTRIDIKETDKINVDKKYDLVAVVYHGGGKSGGHYIIAKQVNDIWYLINDSTVTKIVSLNNSGLGHFRPYLLLYKITSNTPLPTKKQQLTKIQIERLYDVGAYNIMKNYTDWLENNNFTQTQVENTISMSSALLQAAFSNDKTSDDYQQILKLLDGFNDGKEMKRIADKIKINFVNNKSRLFPKFTKNQIIEIYESGAYNVMINYTDWLEQNKFTEQQFDNVIKMSKALVRAAFSNNKTSNDYKKILKLLNGFNDGQEMQQLANTIRTNFIQNKLK